MTENLTHHQPMMVRQFANLEHARLRLFCLAVSIFLIVVSIAAYWQSARIHHLLPWQDSGMTYRFMAAYLLAFAGSLIWVVLTADIAALAGVGIIVGVNAGGMAAYFSIFALQHSSDGLILPILVLAVTAAIGFEMLRRGRKMMPLQSQSTPRFVRASMVIFSAILFVAGYRLINQTRNVFPWDPQPSWSTIIGICITGSACYFAYGAWKGIWTHAGGQFAGFLIYDLILIPPYLRMLRADDPAPGMSASGFTTYADGSRVNDGPLAVFLTAISISLLISVWYLFFDRRTRLFGN